MEVLKLTLGVAGSESRESTGLASHDSESSSGTPEDEKQEEPEESVAAEIEKDEEHEESIAADIDVGEPPRYQTKQTRLSLHALLSLKKSHSTIGLGMGKS